MWSGYAERKYPVFAIFGPIIIGLSGSHAAGAARIAI
jgi:hypothetical protein